MSDAYSTPQQDAEALKAYAIYADLEDTGGGQNVVTFVWECDDTAAALVVPYVAEIRADAAGISALAWDPENDTFVTADEDKVISIDRDDFATHAAFIAAVVSVARDNGLEPAGCWNCSHFRDLGGDAMTAADYAWKILRQYEADEFAHNITAVSDDRVEIACAVGFAPRIVRAAFLSEGCDVEAINYPGEGAIRLAVRLS
jgi:hypothetical protein